MGITGLDWQQVDVKFTEGLDTKTNPKLVIPGKWSQLNNCTLSKDGTPQRRDGMLPYVPGVPYGNGLATLNKELLVVRGPQVSSVSAAAADLETRSGSLGYVGINKTEVRRGSGMQSAMDCATGGGYTCYVWLDSSFANDTVTCTGLNLTLVDETTGTQMLSNVVIKASNLIFCPRVVYTPAAGGSLTSCFMIFYLDAAANALSCVCIETASPTAISGEVQLIVDPLLYMTNIDAVQMALHGLESGAAVSYWWKNADTGGSVRTIHVSASGGLANLDAGPTVLMTRPQLSDLTQVSICTVRLSSTRCGTFAVARTGTMAGMCGAAVTDTWVISSNARQLDAAIPSGVPIAPGSHITGALLGSNTYVYWDQQAQFANVNTGFFPIRTIGVDSALGVVTGPTTLMNSTAFAGVTSGYPQAPSGPWICGKAFAQVAATGSAVYLPCCVMERYTYAGVSDVVTKSEQSTFFLFECTGGKHDVPVVVGSALYGTFGFPLRDGALATGSANNVAWVSTPCSTPALAAGGFAMACSEQQFLSIANGVDVTASGICRLTFTPETTASPSHAQLGQSTYFAGGQLGNYDGLAVTEQGFPLFPEGLSVKIAAGVGGDDLTVGVHNLLAVYEWTDNQGLRHQSAASQPVPFTSLGSDHVVAVVPTLLISQKTNVQIVLYMTQASGTIFYRVISITSPEPNITTAESISITVGGTVHPASDALIVGNEALYTQPEQAGTTLPNLATNPCSALGVHQGRLFTDVTDQPNQFRYSQPYSPPIGLQFHPDLGGSIPQEGGGIVGFSALDAQMIIFCTRRIYAIAGTGPNASGGYNQYSDPVSIPTDVGCVDRHSILRMPLGIIFKAQKGWYLLDRGLTVRYIGAGVAAFDANNVSSATLLESKQECRFSSTSGTQLIYAYLLDQWSTATISVGAIYAVTDALWWSTPTGGLYMHTSISDGLNYDTVGAYLDIPGARGITAAIWTTARTAWLHLATLNGFQRVRWLYLTGTATVAPAGICTVSVDYDDSYGALAPGAYTFGIPYGSVSFSGRSIDTRHKLHRQKCKSIAFTILDVPSIFVPTGVNYQALQLQIGVRKGTNKLPGTQTVG